MKDRQAGFWRCSGCLSNQNKGERYAKLQNKSPRLIGILFREKVAACMLSVAVAAVIFWGITLTGNTEHSDEQMTVAQALRAAGDTLSANADPTKFTGGISSRVKMMELEEQGQASSDDEAEQEAEDVQALLKEDEEIVTGKFLGASQRGGSTLETKTVVEEEVIAYPVQQRETSLLDPGEQKLIQSGVNGKKTVTYEQRIVNGELRSQKAVEETVTQQPVPEIVLVGVAGKAVSPLDFDVELDEAGHPHPVHPAADQPGGHRLQVGSSAMGASGQGLSAGYVAVASGRNSLRHPDVYHQRGQQLCVWICHRGGYRAGPAGGCDRC